MSIGVVYLLVALVLVSSDIAHSIRQLIWFISIFLVFCSTAEQSRYHLTCFEKTNALDILRPVHSTSDVNNTPHLSRCVYLPPTLDGILSFSLLDTRLLCPSPAPVDAQKRYPRGANIMIGTCTRNQADILEVHETVRRYVLSIDFRAGT